MTEKVYYVIMVPMVYAAVLWMMVGIIAKIIGILRAPPHPHTLKIFPERPAPGLVAAAEAFGMPTVLRYQPLLWIFLILFHLGIAALFLAHLDLLPQINLMPAKSPHMLGYGAVGVVVTVSGLYFLFRRFRTPLRELSVPADFLLLFLLFCVFITGDVISWGNSWTQNGFLITKEDFALYSNSLVKFTFANPAAIFVPSHYHMVVAHVFLANLFLIVLPFSKIMHTFFAVPLNRLRRL